MQGYRLLVEEVLKARLKELSKKNRPLYDAVLNKAKEILDNPTHYKQQKIHGRTYAYEAENFWNSGKKQSRQNRRYLGVWDEASGQIISKVAERDVKTTKSLDSAYLLESIGSGNAMQDLSFLFLKKGHNPVTPDREISIKHLIIGLPGILQDWGSCDRRSNRRGPMKSFYSY